MVGGPYEDPWGPFHRQAIRGSRAIREWPGSAVGPEQYSPPEYGPSRYLNSFSLLALPPVFAPDLMGLKSCSIRAMRACHLYI